MISKLFSAGIFGLDAYRVKVEVHIARGLPSFQIVGLPDQQIKESKERIRAALINSGYKFPPRRITVNLSPAGIKKTGSFYDLPIALGIIVAQLNVNINKFNKYIFIGGLALDGSLEKVTGVLPVVEYALRKNYSIILPEENRQEAVIIDGAEVAGMKTLSECFSFLKGEFEGYTEPLIIENSKAGVKTYPDLSSIVGHVMPKRALEIASAGKHNLLFVGSPGVGKSLLSKSICGILPEMTQRESIEITKIYSIAGLLPAEAPLIKYRVFRNPHHTVSFAGMIGGGKDVLPGEVSLAHNGVLFLDELPEFQRKTLEVLRQPLETREVLISRAGRFIKYPANILLIAAMNPCPCGYFGDNKKNCICTPNQIDRYINKISGPLLERIDLQIEVGRINIQNSESISEETSTKVKKRVSIAREKQIQRNAGRWNSEIERKEAMILFKIDDNAFKLLLKITTDFNLSMRSHIKIMRIARTIADLSNEIKVKEEHIFEASSYRLLDRKLWRF